MCTGAAASRQVRVLAPPAPPSGRLTHSSLAPGTKKNPRRKPFKILLLTFLAFGARRLDSGFPLNPKIFARQCKISHFHFETSFKIFQDLLRCLRKSLRKMETFETRGAEECMKGRQSRKDVRAVLYFGFHTNNNHELVSKFQNFRKKIAQPPHAGFHPIFSQNPKDS